MDHTSLRSTRALAVVAVLLLGGVAACGGDDDGGDAAGDATTTTVATSGGDPEDDYGSEADDGDDGGSGSEADGAVVAQGIAFANDLTVEPGGEFIFDNQDSTVHTLTADDGAFDSDEVPGGNQSDPIVAPDEPGEHTFHCEIHASMTGTLTVS